MTFQKVRDKIVRLQGDLDLFKADFLDRDTFKQFADNLSSNVAYEEVCITGYFSETIRNELENIIKRGCHVRLICPEFPEKPNNRDRKNLQALRKLAQMGAEIKLNYRLHARFLVAYIRLPVRDMDGNEYMSGLLVIGSFDFNTECIGKERYDAGIKTTHPDLIKSTIQFFEQIWREPESIDFLKKYA